MINVLPVNDKQALIDLYKKHGYEFNEFSGCVVAKQGEEVLGTCFYYINDESIEIVDVNPIDDIMLADGILRSALHVADFRKIESAFYLDSAPVELFRKLDFIKSEADKSLKIEKLHESCCSCEKS